MQDISAKHVYNTITHIAEKWREKLEAYGYSKINPKPYIFFGSSYKKIEISYDVCDDFQRSLAESNRLGCGLLNVAIDAEGNVKEDKLFPREVRELHALAAMSKANASAAAAMKSTFAREWAAAEIERAKDCSNRLMNLKE